MSVIRSPQVNGNGTAQKTVKSGTKRPLSNKYSEDHFVTGEDSGSENDAYDAKLDFDNSKDYNPNEDSDGGSDKVKRKKLKRENSTDVDDLLDGSTETSEEEEEDEEDALTKFYKQRSEKKQKEEERRKDKERKKIEEKKSKSYSKTEMRDKLESSVKEKIKETAKKMKEEVEAKSAPSIISSLGRIPKISKADSEKKNNGPSFGDMMGGLDTVKPKPKAAPIKNKNKDLLEAFTDLSPIKPKSKSDSKSSSSDKSRSDKDKERSKDKDREKDRTEKDKERSKDKDRDKDRHRSKDKHRDKDRDRDKDRRREKDKEKNKDKDSKRERRDSFSKNSDSSKSEDSERPKPKLSIPEKRSHKESSLPSPQDEKKSPKVIKESNFLGDILGDIMKEPPKKKKRRPSDVKITENNLKDLAEKAKAAEETKEKESSPESEKENTPDNESVQNSNEMEFSEPTSDLPREVRGILVYVKGNKAKKKIQWKEERELVSVEYFEVDETERVNVWKVKTFEEARKKEAMFEKSKLSTGYNEKDEDTEDNKQWKLLPIVFEGDALEAADRLKDTYGRESKEKKVQEERELRVLRALQFNQAPKDPSEPDPGTNDKLGTSVTDIPLEDLSDNKADSFYDHSLIGWPRSSSSFPGVAQDSGPGPAPGANIPTNINALLSNISTMLPSMSSMLPGPAPDLSKPPPGVMSSKEEEEVLAAQMAAAAQLGLGPPAPNFGSGNGHNYNNGGNGYHRGHRGGQRGHYNNDRGYNKSYGNQYNRDRYGGRDGGYNNRRPCKFWMEKGHCKEEDRCLYPHPSR